jgi:hypothetical protein
MGVVMGRRPGMFRSRTEAAIWLTTWAVIAIAVIGGAILLIRWLVGLF